MARSNGAKTKSLPEEPLAVTEPEETETVEAPPNPEVNTPETNASETNTPDMEECLNALKTLLSAVEKLQKVRQEVGDIKPLLIRMLDGEVVAGEELEQLKTGVGGLFRLVRAYSDHQSALEKAQPARQLLDDVLKVRNSSS